MDDCANSKFHECMPAIGTDCDRFAVCYLKPLCGPVGNGNGSCLTALNCQRSRCNFGDWTCGCSCLAGIATSSVSKILGVDGCMLTCGNNPACWQRNCSQYFNRCK